MFTVSLEVEVSHNATAAVSVRVFVTQWPSRLQGSKRQPNQVQRNVLTVLCTVDTVFFRTTGPS